MQNVLQKLDRATARGVETIRCNLTWQARRATSFRRALPSLVIVGAQKSGTTSLYDYLTEHPQLWPAYIKEVHFFDGGLLPKVDNFKKGAAWYRANFPLKSSMQPGEQTFEASPLYMFNPLVAKRMFRLMPDVKIIAVLRNPTERAISHYFHERRYGREPLAIIEALASEERRLASIWANQDYKNETFIHLSYKARGLYAEQLNRFLEYFPRKNLLVISAENFFQEPESVLRQVCQFVEIDPNVQFKNLKPRNIASNRVNVESSVYKSLNHYFSSHNQALYKLFGESFDW